MTVNYWTVACVRLMHSLRLPINYAFLFLSRRHHIKLARIISFQSIILQCVHPYIENRVINPSFIVVKGGGVEKEHIVNTIS